MLSPAGGRESLEAAVRAGADAVYLGGRAFGARANAKNFSNEELAQAVEYCHRRGVRVHVTVNTLLKDNELPDALGFVEFLCSLPVDAVLVQDLGLLALLRERAPGLPLHASTQMSLHTPAGVRLAQELGVSRVVLARELSLAETGEAAQGCQVELESFIHGALCMCVSGQCYLSAMLGGRSGNRGQCAQPCRLPFAAERGTGHDLSLKDLSFIKGIDQLKKAGVCSAKIEGRMKRPEYVAAATAACRLAADGQPVPEELSSALEAVFSRSGFTDGYLAGRLGREMFGTRRKEDVAAASEKVLSGLRGLYRAERQSQPASFALAFGHGRVVLEAACQGETVQASADAGEASLSAGRCRQQLQKTGGTPFFAAQVQVPEEGAPIAVAGLNALRRQALDQLLHKIESRPSIPFQKLPLPPPDVHPKRQGPLPVRAVLRSPEQLCPEVFSCREIVLPIEASPKELDAVRDRGLKLLLELPRAMFGQEKELRALMERRKAKGFTDFVCGNLGALQLCREAGGTAHGAFSLNITNTPALNAFAGLGLKTAELSFELSGREAGAIGGSLPRGIMAYGRQALMLARNCPLANSPKGCLGCKAPGFLTDRKGMHFPVVCRRRGAWGSELLNSVPLWLGDLQSQLDRIDFAVLRFSVESPVEISQVLDWFHQGKALNGGYTRGLFRRGVE